MISEMSQKGDKQSPIPYKKTVLIYRSLETAPVCTVPRHSCASPPPPALQEYAIGVAYAGKRKPRNCAN